MAERSRTNPNDSTDRARPRARSSPPAANAHDGVEARTLLPWAVSIGVHAILIFIGLIVTWTIVANVDDPPPPPVVAAFAETWSPLDSLVTTEPLEAVPLQPLDLSTTEAVELARGDDATPDLGIDASALDALGDGGLDALAPPPATVSFAGVRATSARRIAFVVDASGSMIGAFPTIVRELARSLAALSDEQSFAIFFFQRDEAVAVPPAGRWRTARPNSVNEALAWVRAEIVPRGRSNPVDALERALRMQPDVVYLLSSNVTGSGRFEIEREALLDALDRLNPENPRNGRRRTRIACIQFLDPDPLDTLRIIATRHGGIDGYRFLDRVALGLVPGATGERGADLLDDSGG